jgi:hypothetical protein
MKTAIVYIAAWLVLVGVAGADAPEQPAEKSGRQQADEQAPRPLLTLVEYNPWLMVIGSDSPTFALYDDGTVIFRKRVGEKEWMLQSTKLDPGELEAFTGSVPLKELSELPKSDYAASSATDQPTTALYTWRDGKRNTVSVYGNVRAGIERARREAAKKHPSEDDMLDFRDEDVPRPFLQAIERLVQFDHARARRWLPREIEVMISPYEYAPDESLPWPKGWPGLQDPKTRRRSSTDYSLYLASTELDALRKFLWSRREKQAVLIDGKKWSVSYRMPFPCESAWMSAAP